MSERLEILQQEIDRLVKEMNSGFGYYGINKDLEESRKRYEQIEFELIEEVLLGEGDE